MKKYVGKEIERSKPLSKIKLAVETADKMTTNQLVARVKDFFEKKR